MAAKDGSCAELLRAEKIGGQFNLARAFVSISFGGLLFGFMIGITSNVVIGGQLLCSSRSVSSTGTFTSWGYDACYELSPLWVGIATSLNLVGALAATLICLRFSDDLGRKLELQIGAVMYLVGAAIAAAVPSFCATLAGFFVYGLGIGFSMHAAPVFIAEMSPANVRGLLVSAKEGIVVLGMCFGFLVGFGFAGVETTGWRWMVAVSSPFALVMLSSVTALPESPRFLVLQALTTTQLLGKERYLTKARQSLKFFRQAESVDDVEPELDQMYKDVASSVGTEAASWTDAFSYPDLLVIGCGIVFFQQVTGQPTVLYFASGIFVSAGLGQFAALSSLLVSVVKLVATCVSALRVDQYGRRWLLFVGISLMAVAMAIVSFAFLFGECAVVVPPGGSCPAEKTTLPRAWGILTVAGLMLYVAGYQVGFGPISWLLISEIFPLRVRGAAFSVAATTNFASNIAMTVLQPSLLEVLTPAGLFLLYLALILVSLLFVKRFVPETKGKTMEEVEAMLAKGQLH